MEFRISISLNPNQTQIFSPLFFILLNGWITHLLSTIYNPYKHDNNSKQNLHTTTHRFAKHAFICAKLVAFTFIPYILSDVGYLLAEYYPSIPDAIDFYYNRNFFFIKTIFCFYSLFLPINYIYMYIYACNR